MPQVKQQVTRKSIKMTLAEAARWLEQGANLALATIDRDGYPHLVAMSYAIDRGDIVMTSYGKAQKVLNLRRNPQAAVMVESGRAYNTLKGVMIRGRAEIVEDAPSVLQAMQLIVRRMARLRGQAEGNGTAGAAAVRQATKRVVIRLHPEKWASWDHSKLAPGQY